MEEVELRKYRISDLKRVCELFINDNVIKNLTTPFKAKDVTLREEREWIKKVIKNYKEKEPESFALAIIYNGEYIGSINIHKIDYNHEKAEIGYWIGEPYWGKGIMPKAVKKFLKIAFNKFKLKRIEGLAHLRNKPSQRVLEKSGFKLEGIKRKSVKRYGKFIDETIYAIVR